MKARIWATLAVCVAILGLVGCTTSTAGTAAPGPEGTESPASTKTEPDTHGAPRVEHPLDASRFLTDPCAVLTPAQLATFSVTRPGDGDTESEIAKAAGPSCAWHADPAASSTISVALMSGNKHGLADLYGMRDESEYFEETTVEGYPAVFNDPTDSRDEGICNIHVGVSDALAFFASENGTLDADGACSRAEQVAAAVIVTMRGN